MTAPQPPLFDEPPVFPPGVCHHDPLDLCGRCRPTPAAGELVITVHGTPVGQGSMTRNQHGALYSDNAKRLRPWRVALKTGIEDVLAEQVGQLRPFHDRGVPVPD